MENNMFKKPILIAALNLVVSTIIFAQSSYPVDLKVVAKIREEGFQRSEITNTLSYMTDVLGARLTNSDAVSYTHLTLPTTPYV